MSEWIKFSEKWPESDTYFYYSPNVNDGKVKILNLHPSFITGEDAYWREIEITLPATPEKERHECFKRSCAGTFLCEELSTGYLELSHDSARVIVPYCPFCGFTLEKK